MSTPPDCALMPTPLDCALMPTPLDCALMPTPLDCALMPTPLNCALMPTPLDCALMPTPLDCALMPTPLDCALMPTPLDCTGMSTTSTSSQPLVAEPLHLEWTLLNDFEWEGAELWNVELSQPIQAVENLHGEGMESSTQNRTLMELGSEMGVVEPPNPVEVNYLSNGGYQPEMLLLYGNSHEVNEMSAPLQFLVEQPSFNVEAPRHIPTEEERQFQADSRDAAVTEEGMLLNAEIGALLKEAEELDTVPLPVEESTVPLARVQQTPSPSQEDGTNLSPEENRRSAKNAYSKRYREIKKAEIEQLEVQNPLLKQHAIKIDDVNKRLQLCDAQLDAIIESLLDAHGRAGTVTFTPPAFNC